MSEESRWHDELAGKILRHYGFDVSDEDLLSICEQIDSGNARCMSDRSNGGSKSFEVFIGDKAIGVWANVLQDRMPCPAHLLRITFGSVLRGWQQDQLRMAKNE